MGLLSKIGQSADLMQGLATRMDVDLGARILADPDHAAQVFRTMVLRCSQCDGQSDCASLQAANPHIDAAPAYCRNREVLDANRP